MSQYMDRSLHLPSQLHHNGNLSPIRPREKMPTVYRHRQSPSREHLKKEGVQWPKDNSYLRKRLNNDIELERSTMIMKTGRTSQDNPEWMTVNFDNYRRDRFQPVRKGSHIEERHFDVFNNPRQQFYGRNEDHYFNSMIKEDAVRGKDVQGSQLRQTFNHFLMYQPEVADKVGSTNSRDYSIPRPLLKIGKDSCVDTYSPF